MPENIRSFLETTAAEIRWKKARPALIEEIETHLLDQRNAYVADGMTPEDAEQEAIRQMGDPVSLGAELDRVHQPRPQWGLLVFAALLLIVGALLRNTLTAGMRPYYNSALRDLLSVLLGLGCLAGGYLLDVCFLGKRARVLLGSFCLAVLLFFLFTPTVSNAYWLVRQVMLLFPVFFAALMWSQRRKGWRGALLSLGAAGVGLVGALLVPSTFIVFLVILSAFSLGLLFCLQDWFSIGKRLGTALTSLLVSSTLGYFLWSCRNRWQYALFPKQDPAGQGYFAAMIRQALQYAQWIGPADAGAWEAETGLALNQMVPELDSDCLLVNMICKFGWLPFLLLMTAFALFFAWAIWKALCLRHTLGRAVALAVLVTLLSQCVGALMTTFGLPIMSASFPLVVGNTTTVINMFLIGLLLSAFRDGSLPESKLVDTAPSQYRFVVKLVKLS